MAKLDASRVTRAAPSRYYLRSRLASKPWRELRVGRSALLATHDAAPVSSASPQSNLSPSSTAARIMLSSVLFLPVERAARLAVGGALTKDLAPACLSTGAT
jgi:hypothetical protein